MTGPIYAKGHNGQITVDGDWLTIERKGLGRIGHAKGDRRIPLVSITAFAAVRTYVEDYIARHVRGATTPTAAAPAGLAQQLQELATLRDQGLLTDDEFAAQKIKLLNG